jgi:hypothetical protein
MNDDDIYRKTSAGLAEVRERSGGLPQRLRSILILVDGVRHVVELRHAAATLGAPADTLTALQSLGLIELAIAAPPRAQAGGTGGAASTAGTDRSDWTERVLDRAQTARPTTEAERFRAAKKFMNDTVVDALGIRAFVFTLKLEKCAVLADLEALRLEYLRLLSKARGDEVAGALETRLRHLLR